jgi:CRISPR type I-E-associated protein CasB/Cse2
MSFKGYELLEEWWKTLESNKGERAAFRRCRSVNDVSSIAGEYFFPMRSKMRKADVKVGTEQLALTMILLAHVKDVAPAGKRTFAAAMAAPNSRGKPTVSLLRFKQFIQSDTREEAFPYLLSFLSMINTKTVTLERIAETIWFWSPLSSENSYKHRFKWSESYYGGDSLDDSLEVTDDDSEEA